MLISFILIISCVEELLGLVRSSDSKADGPLMTANEVIYYFHAIDFLETDFRSDVGCLRPVVQRLAAGLYRPLQRTFMRRS
jgi:hypothetical protein